LNHESHPTREPSGRVGAIAYAAAPPQRGSRPRRWSLVVLPAILLSLVVAGFALVTLSPLREAIWRTALTRTMSDERATQDLAGYAGGPGFLPPSVRVVRAEVESGRDSVRWYKFSVDPADVVALKAAIVSHRVGQSNEVDDLSSLTGGAKPPTWWDVQILPDPDVLTLQR
jgi:hypothetical protein